MCSLDNKKLKIDTDQGFDAAKEFKVDICEHTLNYIILEDTKSEHIQENYATDNLNHTVLEDITSEHVGENYAIDELDLNYDYREDIVEPELVQFHSGELNSTSGKCEQLNNRVKFNSVNGEYSSVANARHDASNDQRYPYEYTGHVNTEIGSPTYYRECSVLLESIESDSSQLHRASETNEQLTETSSSETSLRRFYKTKQTENCDLRRDEQVCECSNSAETPVEEDYNSDQLTDEYDDSNLSTSLEEFGPRSSIHLSLSNFSKNNTEPRQKSLDNSISMTTCHLCEAQIREQHLANHMEMHHTENIQMYQCQQCDYRTKYRSHFSAHFNGIHAKNPKIYKCQFCPMKTKYKQHLVRHITVKHDPIVEWYYCYQCKFRTKNRGNLIGHIRRNHGNMNLCHGDSKYHTTEEQSQRGNVTGCVTRSHKKDGDSMTNSNETEIHQHESYNHRTKYKNNIMQHVHFSEIHTKDLKIFECQFCALKYKYKNHLTRHVTVNHDPLARWYRCYQCEFRTKDRGNLVKYIRRIHRKKGLKLHKCQFCSLKTTYKMSLKRHFTVKHDRLATWYHCYQCEFRTKVRGNLIRHIRKIHRKIEILVNLTL